MSIFSLTNCCIGFERRFNDLENFPVKTILLCINITLSRTSQTHPIATSNGKQPIEDREVTLACTNESSKCRKIAKNYGMFLSPCVVIDTKDRTKMSRKKLDVRSFVFKTCEFGTRALPKKLVVILPILSLVMPVITALAAHLSWRNGRPNGATRSRFSSPQREHDDLSPSDGMCLSCHPS